MTTIGIPKEIHPGEKRVAATPQTVLKLKKLGFDVVVESHAGHGINTIDSEYREAGAIVIDGTKELWAASDVIMKVRPPEENKELGIHEADLLKEGATLVGFIWPAQNKEMLDRMAKRKATVFGMDCVPRITRAQKMDTLSAMANIAGYRAIIEAANHFPRFFTGQITAAGKIDPAKVLIIGAGVAGLSAIGAAKGLGAIVRAFDPRSATKDQVASMGAEFLDLDIKEKEEGEGKGGYAKEMSDAFLKAEMALFAAQAMQVDIIVTTALIPGKPAPKLITQGMVESMKPGSVIVDLAAEQGGNCVLTEPGTVVKHKGVSIIGYTDLPSRMASMSSQLYGACIVALLTDLAGGRTLLSASGLSPDQPGPDDSAHADKSVRPPFNINLEDEVVRGAIVLHEGKMVWPPPVVAVTAAPPPEPGVPSQSSAAVAAAAPKKSGGHGHDEGTGASPWLLAVVGLIAVGIGIVAPASTLSHFTVFMLACFVGYQVVWNVKPALHTPLMSVTNAISGIILVGGMLQLGGTDMNLTTILGAVAVLIAAINIAGGFLVTNRMLAMFRK